MRKSLRPFALVLCGIPGWLAAQETFPVNGVADPRTGYYALTHATLVKDPSTTITDATLIIREGRIVSSGRNLKTPEGAVEVNCTGKYIYPSFIDLYTDYGMPQATPATRGSNFFSAQPMESATKGAYAWNQSIHPETDAFKIFTKDEARAKLMRDLGFGVVLTHARDGIARGSGAVVSLANTNDNFVVISEQASAHYSFNKGSSSQAYPSSLMGVIALLRQTYLDARWYQSSHGREGTNLSLEAWNRLQNLPQIFEANDKWNDLRADRIGDEFGVQYIIKAGQNEYQRMAEIKATGASFILPLNFPLAQDVEDPTDARFVSLEDLKHWELAPTLCARFEQEGIPFCLTTSDLADPKSFLTNLRSALNYGLSEKAALTALTLTPARLLHLDKEIGSLDNGKWANFIITSGPLFNERTQIYQNWVQGTRYGVRDEFFGDPRGKYKIVLKTDAGERSYTLDFKSNTAATLMGKDTATSRFYYDGRQVRINVAPERRGGENLRLSGIVSGTDWVGTGEDSTGKRFSWTASFDTSSMIRSDSVRKRPQSPLGPVTYPFGAYGATMENRPKQQTILIKNATVWTNEAEGVLTNADVLIRDGKIAAVGKALSAAGARVIDGTGKHVTPGVIDEHSHIATASINEGGQSVTSEVRIGDNLNPDDINIYRQLSGGVTTSHILHGSANTIGGQTQLIKLRWGMDDEELKFTNGSPFIKFALGENVKRSYYATGNSSANNRFPDTRMGVEQVLVDAFTRAHAYEDAWKAYNTSKDKNRVAPRRDLELDALVEILNDKRFITCHSYIQSEILSSIEVANRMGYHYNTFTHILEGYKVADKLKEHGANASTFSDWWAYKVEVQDAIAYNAAIMQRMGLNVAINSDDAEMARRLNQEAAKTIKYGGMSEQEALKMVTLNPAKMLHVDQYVGSLKPGKDGDVVVWSDNPLSIYAKSLYTIVDGAIYFDREQDAKMEQSIAAERNRIIRKMIGEKRGGAPVQAAQPSYQLMYNCSEHMHDHGLLVIDGEQQ